MTTDLQARRYRQLRAADPFLPARVALYLARGPERAAAIDTDAQWQELPGHRGGTYRVRIVTDEEHDDIEPVTLAEALETFHKYRGQSRGMSAYLAPRWMEHANGPRECVGITVDVDLGHGRTGSASLWGIDSYESDPYWARLAYWADVIDELREDATADAKRVTRCPTCAQTLPEDAPAPDSHEAHYREARETMASREADLADLFHRIDEHREDDAEEAREELDAYGLSLEWSEGRVRWIMSTGGPHDELSWSMYDVSGDLRDLRYVYLPWFDRIELTDVPEALRRQAEELHEYVRTAGPSHLPGFDDDDPHNYGVPEGCRCEACYEPLTPNDIAVDYYPGHVLLAVVHDGYRQTRKLVGYEPDEVAAEVVAWVEELNGDA